jgi:hypothetical protein
LPINNTVFKLILTPFRAPGALSEPGGFLFTKAVDGLKMDGNARNKKPLSLNMGRGLVDTVPI